MLATSLDVISYQTCSKKTGDRINVIQRFQCYTKKKRIYHSIINKKIAHLFYEWYQLQTEIFSLLVKEIKTERQRCAM